MIQAFCKKIHFLCERIVQEANVIWMKRKVWGLWWDLSSANSCPSTCCGHLLLNQHFWIYKVRDYAGPSVWLWSSFLYIFSFPPSHVSFSIFIHCHILHGRRLCLFDKNKEGASIPKWWVKSEPRIQITLPMMPQNHLCDPPSSHSSKPILHGVSFKI